MDRKTSLLCESIQDVTLVAWPIVWRHNAYDQDSREVLITLREWGEEFQNWWDAQSDDFKEQNSYMDEVEAFALKRAHEYTRDLIKDRVFRFFGPDGMDALRDFFLEEERLKKAAERAAKKAAEKTAEK